MKRFLLLLTVSWMTMSSLAVVKEPAAAIVNDSKMEAPVQTEHRLKPNCLHPLLSAYPAMTAKRGLIILVDFPDQQFSSDNPLGTWARIVNEVGYHEGMAYGSVHDYYLEQSSGLFDLRFDVVGPVTMAQPVSYYGTNDEYGDDLHADEMVKLACLAVASDVCFADYDWDGDGEVEQVYVIYAGQGENNNTVKRSLIWAHEYRLSGWEGGEPLVIDSIAIDTYACSGELNSNYGLAGIGTICHEFAHCLGLPDLYNVSTGVSTFQGWDLMDSGNYNGEGWYPCNLSAYERYFCGWLTLETLDVPCDVTGMAPLAKGGTAYRINGRTENNFWVLENRQQTGWDAHLPGHGLRVTAIDYDPDAWKNNTVNSYSGNRVKNVSYRQGSIQSLQLTDIKEENGLVAFRYRAEETDAVTPVAAESVSAGREYNMGNGIVISDGRKFFRRR